MKTIFKHTQWLAAAIAITFGGCTAPVYNATNDELAKIQLDNINISLQGQHITERPNMADSCRGFFINEKQIKRFFEHAVLTVNKEKNLLKLPCFSQGTASLSGEKFNWVIRAGGIGEFSNQRTSFSKMCGIACCNKIQGIC